MWFLNLLLKQVMAASLAAKAWFGWQKIQEPLIQDKYALQDNYGELLCHVAAVTPVIM